MITEGNKDKKTESNECSGVMAAIAKMRQEMDTTPNAGYNQSSNTNKRQKLELPPRVVKPVSSIYSTGKNKMNTTEPASRLRTEFPPRVEKPVVESTTNNTPILPCRVEKPNNTETTSTIVTSAKLLHSLESRTNRSFTIDRTVHQTPPSGKTFTNIQTFSQIQVARSQTGNPLLEYLPIYQTNSKIRDVDYIINSKCIALFLSLKYHKLHPEYVYNKLKKVTYNREDTLRVLLVLVDITDFQDVIRELNKIALFNKLSLIIAWSNEQCAMYLQNLKSVEKEASKKIIQGSRTKDEEVLSNEGRYLERVLDTISSVKSVSQSNAKSLLAKHGSVKAIIAASADDLTAIDGLGPLKVDRLLKAFNHPFLGGS